MQLAAKRQIHSLERRKEVSVRNRKGIRCPWFVPSCFSIARSVRIERRWWPGWMPKVKSGGGKSSLRRMGAPDLSRKGRDAR
jgi:hypothetical protein